MIKHVHLHRIAGVLLILVVLSGCSMWDSWFGREEIYVGEYITLTAEEAIEDQGTLWIFSQLPDSSQLSGFLPSDTAKQISFIPDVPGEYDIVLQLSVEDEIEESSYKYSAITIEDTTLLNSEIPSHLVEVGYNGDTTVSDTPAVTTLTDEGDQRRYLAKIIKPGRPKAPAKRRSTTIKKKRTAAKLSRGNLIPKAAKTFTIQVSSWPSLEEAQVASKELLDTYGIDSYIQRAFFKDKDEIYYRLRVGNFQEQDAATAYAKEIQKQTNLPVWVDHVRKEM
jgi:hypothetical protein